MKPEDVSHQRTDMDFWVWLDNVDFVFEVNWAVTFYLKLFLVRLTKSAVAAHVDEARE